MHHRITVAVVATALVLVGCSSDRSASEPAASKTVATAASETAKLSEEWVPKLEDATDGPSGVCAEVGDPGCADHLTEITLAVSDLESAIQEAGAKDAYPRSMKEIAKVNAAVDAYTEHECLGDPNAGIDGSPCPEHAYTIMAGGASLQFTLATDELKAA